MYTFSWDAADELLVLELSIQEHIQELLFHMLVTKMKRRVLYMIDYHAQSEKKKHKGSDWGMYGVFQISFYSRVKEEWKPQCLHG
jgi:hypothetical protein